MSRFCAYKERRMLRTVLASAVLAGFVFTSPASAQFHGDREYQAYDSQYKSAQDAYKNRHLQGREPYLFTDKTYRDPGKARRAAGRDKRCPRRWYSTDAIIVGKRGWYSENRWGGVCY
jgi:hypothetical protein